MKRQFVLYRSHVALCRHEPIAAVAWLVERIAHRWLRLLGIGLLAGGLSWVATFKIIWLEAGRCLPGLIVAYLVACLISLFRRNKSTNNRQVQLTRLLLAVLASAFLARMFLNARIYHYGYYQATLAAILVPAVLIGELSHWIGVRQRGASVIAIGTFALLVPGVVRLSIRSNKLLNLKTVPVGTNGDQFYAYSSQVDPTGEIVNAVSQALRKTPNQTLLVLPEGVMINYLARLPSSIAPYSYYFTATAEGRENRIVEDLERHPPDWVVIISRNLREYGVERYGDQPDEGQQILRWVNENYDMEASTGGDPLDYRQRGAVILRRKPGLQ